MSENEVQCLFCKMATELISVEFLFENEHVFAINDINPRAPVHVLIIPKFHISNASQLTKKSGRLLGEIFNAATIIAEQKNISKSGYRLAFNVGDDGGMTISHLHLHLIGGKQLGPEG